MNKLIKYPLYVLAASTILLNSIKADPMKDFNYKTIPVEKNQEKSLYFNSETAPVESHFAGGLTEEVTPFSFKPSNFSNIEYLKENVDNLEEITNEYTPIEVEKKESSDNFVEANFVQVEDTTKPIIKTISGGNASFKPMTSMYVDYMVEMELMKSQLLLNNINYESSDINWLGVAGILGLNAYFAERSHEFYKDQFWWGGEFNFAIDSKYQIMTDKIGHMVASYGISIFLKNMFKQTGMSSLEAAIWGSTIAFGHKVSNEIHEGHSDYFGFDFADLAGDFLGSAFSVLQEIYPSLKRFYLQAGLNPRDDYTEQYPLGADAENWMYVLSANVSDWLGLPEWYAMSVGINLNSYLPGQGELRVWAMPFNVDVRAVDFSWFDFGWFDLGFLNDFRETLNIPLLPVPAIGYDFGKDEWEFRIIAQMRNGWKF